MFIAIDGPNGVGKSTLCEAVTSRLAALGHQVVSLRQPSRSPLGNFARSSEHKLFGLPLAALVVADRYLQVHTEIRPALERGDAVVLDRYVASTLVLQRLDGVDIDLLWAMNAQILVPDLVVILTADPTLIYERMADRRRLSRFEQQAQVAELEVAYFQDAADLLAANGYPVMALDTSALTVDELTDAVLDRVAPDFRD